MQEFFNFTATTIGERTEKGLRQSVEHNRMMKRPFYFVEYIAHAYRLSSGICGVVICEKNYPTRVAFSLISRALDVFMVEVPSEEIEKMETSVKLDKIDELLKLYQDPVQADPILRVQKDLDETKIVLHKTFETLLHRGENIDALIDRSEDLKDRSKVFFKAAKKTNSPCCSIQ